VTTRPFGALPDGEPVDLYCIRVGRIELHAISLGGIITSLRCPDRAGRMSDVVLGHDRLDPYLDNRPYLGAIVGRYANRIADGRFDLDGATYQLARNDGANHLHGGKRGFDRHVWTAAPIRSADGAGVHFTRISPAGEEHYPGTLRVSVLYMLRADSSVVLHYEASTDAPTILNLTQHTYFNLAGDRSTSILDHELTIYADRYTPVGPTLLPTGELATVQGTPLDFRTPVHIGCGLRRGGEQLDIAGGYDHNLVLTRPAPRIMPAAELTDSESGRILRVATTEPGIQFYDGHLLDPAVEAAYGRVLAPHLGLCLETQHFPDSPNHPEFPSVMLRPGKRYTTMTIWQFATR
jgi:aldose 1-epimerase